MLRLPSSTQPRFYLVVLGFILLILTTGYLASLAIWQDPAGNIVTNLNTGWGDLLFHVRAGVFFSEQSTWPTESFFLAGQPVGYAYAADFISSLLLSLNWPLALAFQIPTITLTVIGVALTIWLAWRLTNSGPTALLGTSLFITFGGLGAWPLLFSLPGPLASWPTYLRDLPYTFTVWHEAGYMIINPFVTMLHQRAYLIGWPVFLALLLAMYSYLHKPRIKYLALVCLLTLLLAFTHPFTWVASLLILPTWLVWFFILKHQRPKVIDLLLAALALLIILVGGYFIIKSLQPNATVSSITWSPGWLAPDISWPLFWLKNIGLYLFIMPFATKFLLRRQVLLASLMLASLTPFVAANLFQFAPWIWDNTKLLAPVWLIVSIGTASAITHLWSRRPSGTMRLAIISVIFFLIFSGTLELLRLPLYNPAPRVLYTAANQELARLTRLSTKPSDKILTAPAAEHPIFGLAGRPSITAYEGWLWSQGWRGIYETPLADSITIYQGNQGARILIEKYGIEYVAIGPPEIAAGTNTDWFNNNFPSIVSHNGYQLYDVRSLDQPSP